MTGGRNQNSASESEVMGTTSIQSYGEVMYASKNTYHTNLKDDKDRGWREFSSQLDYLSIPG